VARAGTMSGVEVQKATRPVTSNRIIVVLLSSPESDRRYARRYQRRYAKGVDDSDIASRGTKGKYSAAMPLCATSESWCQRRVDAPPSVVPRCLGCCSLVATPASKEHEVATQNPQTRGAETREAHGWDERV